MNTTNHPRLSDYRAEIARIDAELAELTEKRRQTWEAYNTRAVQEHLWRLGRQPQTDGGIRP